MPYENGDYNTENFLSELTIVENIMEQNLDCLVVCGGDFYVDFSRDWIHTKILHNFCKCVLLHPTVEHSNFDMIRFQIVDHFLLSAHLYRDAVTSYNVLYDTCNTWDHDLIVLHLNLPIPRFSFFKKQFRVKPAWNRATEGQLTDYSDNPR